MPEIGTRDGPRIELMVRCGGCKHLGTETTYGSNDYEEDDWVCRAGGGTKYLPFSADMTPVWCPLMPPAVADLRAAVEVANGGAVPDAGSDEAE